MKHIVNDCALFGGGKLFSSVRPIGQLASGSQDQFMSYIDRIYDDRRLTNNGALVQELESRLASLHGVSNCVAIGNASLGLIIIMSMLAKGKKGEVIMPAFTYPGLPHLAIWAGQTPVFCDIDSARHTIDITSVRRNISESTTSILGVHQFNYPCEIDELTNLAKEYDLPLFFDSVHGVASTYKGRMVGQFGVAEVFSLHATKLINGFEGGYITTNNSEFALELKSRRNFGFDSLSGRAKTLGMNAKLNEFHAAMALCSLETLDGVILRNEQRYKAYCESMSHISGMSILAYNSAEKSNYEFVIIEIHEDWPLTRDQTVELLRAENALCRAYYSPPLHHDENFNKYTGLDGLPTTEKLAQRFIQMPVGERLTIEDIHSLSLFFEFIYNNAGAIASRLDKHEIRNAK